MMKNYQGLKKGAINVLIATFIYVGIFITIVLWPESPLRNDEGGFILSPFLRGITPIIFLYFVTIAVTFEVTVGTITSSKDVGDYMTESISEMSNYIVLFLLLLSLSPISVGPT